MAKPSSSVHLPSGANSAPGNHTMEPVDSDSWLLLSEPDRGKD